MFAGKLAARTGAAENGLGRVGEIRRGSIVFRAAAFAVAKKKGAIRGSKKADEFPFQDNPAGVFDSRRVGSQGIGVGFVYLHPVPPVFASVFLISLASGTVRMKRLAGTNQYKISFAGA